MNNIERIIEFLTKANGLKSAFRYGDMNVPKESSAEHSWRVALMVFLIAQESKINVDLLKAIKIALVHDLPEALTGDIDALKISIGEISKEDKQKAEIEAMDKFKNILLNDSGNDIHDLWHEYEEAKTDEAKFVKAVDKLETLAHIIDLGYETYDVPDFIAKYGNKDIKNFPELKPYLKEIKKGIKEEFKKGNFEWKDEYDDF